MDNIKIYKKYLHIRIRNCRTFKLQLILKFFTGNAQTLQYKYTAMDDFQASKNKTTVSDIHYVMQNDSYQTEAILQGTFSMINLIIACSRMIFCHRLRMVF